MIQYLRKIGRQKLHERLEAIKNDENLPNDILTAILSNMSANLMQFKIFNV